MESSGGAGVTATALGLHPNVVHSIERLRRHHHTNNNHHAATPTKHRLALWDVRPLDRKNAKYVVDFLEQCGNANDDDNNNSNNNVVIVSQLVLAYCDLSLEAVQVLCAHFERASTTLTMHLEKVTLSHLRGLGGGGGMNGTAAAASLSPLHQLLAALHNNPSVTELCLDNVLLFPLAPAVAALRNGNNNNEDPDNNNNTNNALGQLLQANRHITTLSCSTTPLGLPGMLGMQSGLFYNDTLKELDLNDVHLGNGGLEALVRAIVGQCNVDATTTNAATNVTMSSSTSPTTSIIHSKSRIQVLSLAQNQITWRGLPSLARLLQQSKYLKSLILRLNRGILDISTSDTAAAWPPPPQQQGQPPLSAQACRQVFCEALRENKTLTLLSLSDCSVRGTSAAMIVQALAATTTPSAKQAAAAAAVAGNTTLQILELDGFRLDSDVQVCRAWDTCLPHITGLRHLTIHLDFGRNAGLLAALHKNLSLETISRRRRDVSSGSNSSNSNSGRRLVRSNSIGSEGSSSSTSATAAADDAVYCILERNRLARLAQESFGFPPPPPSIHDSTPTVTRSSTTTNIITPGILYQSILRVTRAADTTADGDTDTDDDDGASSTTAASPLMNAGGMAHVLYQILRPRIDIIVQQQQGSVQDSS